MQIRLPPFFCQLQGSIQYPAMSAVSILEKLMLSNFSRSTKVRNDFSERFDTVRGYKEDDPLTCDLCNFAI